MKQIKKIADLHQIDDQELNSCYEQFNLDINQDVDSIYLFEEPYDIKFGLTSNAKQAK